MSSHILRDSPDHYAGAAAHATARAVAAAYPYLGLGPQVKARIDIAATDALAQALTTAIRHGLGPITVAACEGARDGAPPLILPPAAGPGAVQLVCDPVDGTLNAARGGPRAVSVAAFTQAPSVTTYLDDSQAIFAIGAHSVDVSHALDTSPFPIIAVHLQRPELLTATLHRDDNLALLRALAGPQSRITIGSRTGYRPTLAGPGWVAVGDASIPLPYECDLEFGRIGLVEAQIQSGLYRSWCGLVVSRDRIRSRADGLAGYLHSYLQARDRADVDALRALFTSAELARFDAADTPITEVTETLRQRNFGIGTDAVVAIAALSTPTEPSLTQREPLLHAPCWSSGTNRLDVDTLIRTPAGISRRLESVAVTEPGVLPCPARDWYRDLSWTTVAECEDLAALAEGRNPLPTTAFHEVQR
ncbi:MAG: hypothetical protein JWN03_4316 [Nocardia sp.]|uniref:fructose-bisphosphatase class II n=1 Tax=Nocardia sp. TaxID=1821 RepID=UPI00260EBFEC|nr:fructose-bisphosphatase class II [Nocardia sp.]MCU1644041.1 hypothetical protein [Nocardia sp.]